MPSQKRPFEATTTTPPASPSPPLVEEEKPEDLLPTSENRNPEEAKNDSDSDESSDSSSGEKDEYITVRLAEIRKEVQCPICLGIIRKTRTVMECLHRFCRECIDKSMRLGNNECPACRTHCASRRSLRDDPNYDALIAALYTDIDKYEEEEFAFHGEEIARNKQIQASIAQTFRRQAEALGKKRTSSRTTAATYARKQGNYRNLRGRKNHRVVEQQDSDEDEGANDQDCSKDSSSADEHSPEIKSKRYKRRGTRTSQPSSGANADEDNDSEANGELLAWGRGGTRSKNRRSGLSWAHGKISRYNRLSKLMERLQAESENNEQPKVGITLVSLHKDKIPSFKRPFLNCNPIALVDHLCQYVAMQASMETSEIEILLVKNHPINHSSSFNVETDIFNPGPNELKLLNKNMSLREIHASVTEQKLVLAYRQKEQEPLSVQENPPNIAHQQKEQGPRPLPKQENPPNIAHQQKEQGPRPLPMQVNPPNMAHQQKEQGPRPLPMQVNPPNIAHQQKEQGPRPLPMQVNPPNIAHQQKEQGPRPLPKHENPPNIAHQQKEQGPLPKKENPPNIAHQQKEQGPPPKQENPPNIAHQQKEQEPLPVQENPPNIAHRPKEGPLSGQEKPPSI